MAEESDQERTEEPTERRLQQARQRGQIPRSREFNTAVMILLSALAFWIFGARLSNSFANLMRQGLSLKREDILQPESMLRMFSIELWEAFKPIAPLLLLLTLAALVAPISIGGWNFSGEALQPKFERINPWNGLKRIVSMHGLIELGKSLLKVLVVGIVTWMLVRYYWGAMLGLSREPLLAALAHSGDILTFSLVILAASLGLIAGIDVPLQLWQYKRGLRMTKQEVRDEMKDIEGKPEVKGRIRQLQMEAATRRMMEDVPKADVVVTNPTHYAVALKYDPQAGGAPRVLAKGADLIAAQIRNVASSAGITVLSTPPLARSLYHASEIGKEIPTGLYMAVAQVLAYVYQLRNVRRHGGEAPLFPNHLPIPPELVRDD